MDGWLVGWLDGCVKHWLLFKEKELNTFFLNPVDLIENVSVWFCI